jgi:predicted metal-dependent phosphoesterase TrpH
LIVAQYKEVTPFFCTSYLKERKKVMKTDFHVHSNYSDGKMNPETLFEEASQRGLVAMSVTDHDSLDAQEEAISFAKKQRIWYVSGLELNVTFSHRESRGGKAVSLDFLAYGYDIRHRALGRKLRELRDYRKKRGEKILKRINAELRKEGLETLSAADLLGSQPSADAALGRPHLARYLIERGIVRTRQEAFDKYLVKCNVPKLPLSLEEAAGLVHDAGGMLFFAHPNDSRGTSLIKLTESLEKQHQIIEESMLPHIDGIECWHPRHTPETIQSYIGFAKKHGLLTSGGSDCHQDPVLLGSVDVPDEVAYGLGFPREA